MTTTPTPTIDTTDALLTDREPPIHTDSLGGQTATSVRTNHRRPLAEGSTPISRPMLAAAAVAAPMLLRGVAKWRSNPKHKKVHNVMTAGAVVVHDHESVAEASHKLEACDIGALPVGSHGNLVGMITDRDVVTQVIARGLDPKTTYVRELAFDAPVVVSGSDSVRDAAKLMGRHGVRRLPVIEHERLVGVISQADVVNALEPERAGTLLQRISAMPSNDTRPN